MVQTHAGNTVLILVTIALLLRGGLRQTVNPLYRGMLLLLLHLVTSESNLSRVDLYLSTLLRNSNPVLEIQKT